MIFDRWLGVLANHASHLPHARLLFMDDKKGTEVKGAIDDVEATLRDCTGPQK
jgi:hypothetical protein